MDIICVYVCSFVVVSFSQAYRFNVTHSAVGIVFSDDLEKSGSYQIRFPLRHVPSPDVKRVGIGNLVYP